MIQRFSQVKGVDYSVTYSPVVRCATSLPLVILLNLFVYQVDAITAFFQGDLTRYTRSMEHQTGPEAQADGAEAHVSYVRVLQDEKWQDHQPFYVDDFLLYSNDHGLIDDVKQKL